MEINKPIETKFRFYPSDNPYFVPGLEIEGLFAVGQSFIEASDGLLPEFKKNPVSVELRLKLTDSSKAKPVKDLIKGLFAMFKMQKEMFEDEPERARCRWPSVGRVFGRVANRRRRPRQGARFCAACRGISGRKSGILMEQVRRATSAAARPRHASAARRDAAKRASGDMAAGA